MFARGLCFPGAWGKVQVPDRGGVGSGGPVPGYLVAVAGFHGYVRRWSPPGPTARLVFSNMLYLPGFGGNLFFFLKAKFRVSGHRSQLYYVQAQCSLTAKEGGEPLGRGAAPSQGALEERWLQRQFRPRPLLCSFLIVKGNSSVLYHHQDQGRCVLVQP